MTHADATALATTEATSLGINVEVWEHIGGQSPAGVILPTGRFVTRPVSSPAPRYAWRLVETVTPEAQLVTILTPLEIADAIVADMVGQGYDVANGTDPWRDAIAQAITDDREAHR